jgi:superoxide dismutase, Fe-Mn family
MDAPAVGSTPGPSILPLPFDPARLRGLSERLLQSHHQNNYGGAVKRLHAIRAELGALDWASVPGFRINGLKREELIAANSMFLHELYFACLGGDGVLPQGGLSVGIERDFQSVERWRAEFMALALALGGGSGWALLSWSAREHRLINHWSADHAHLLSGATPILALDMYEHSYHLDYGSNAKAYIAAFMDNLLWSAVAERYVAAVEASTQALAAPPGDAKQGVVVVVDVRRKAPFDAATDMIEGAIWRDPKAVDAWAAEFADKPVVVYCVYGHEVGQSTAARLRDAGIDARYLVGGIDEWKKAGRPLQPK